MRLTSLRRLAVVCGAGAGLGVIACAILLDGGRAPVAVPTALFLPILIVAVGVAVDGWRVRRLRQGKATRMRPLQAARVAVLAQACSRSGAFFAGLAGACAAIFRHTGHTGYVRAQVLSLLLACGASLFLALCGWVAERWCVVEGDDDDENLDGYQASGAST